jgi:hypothetical protein
MNKNDQDSRNRGEAVKFVMTTAKKIAKGSTHRMIDVSKNEMKYKGHDVYIVWIETPDKHAADLASAIGKHPDIHVIDKGNDPGDYDWAADVYNRDTSWVTFVISKVVPK